MGPRPQAGAVEDLGERRADRRGPARADAVHGLESSVVRGGFERLQRLDVERVVDALRELRADARHRPEQQRRVERPAQSLQLRPASRLQHLRDRRGDARAHARQRVEAADAAAPRTGRARSRCTARRCRRPCDTRPRETGSRAARAEAPPPAAATPRSARCRAREAGSASASKDVRTIGRRTRPAVATILPSVRPPGLDVRQAVAGSGGTSIGDRLARRPGSASAGPDLTRQQVPHAYSSRSRSACPTSTSARRRAAAYAVARDGARDRSRARAKLAGCALMRLRIPCALDELGQRVAAVHPPDRAGHQRGGADVAHLGRARARR